MVTGQTRIFTTIIGRRATVLLFVLHRFRGGFCGALRRVAPAEVLALAEGHGTGMLIVSTLCIGWAHWDYLHCGHSIGTLSEINSEDHIDAFERS